MYKKRHKTWWNFQNAQFYITHYIKYKNLKNKVCIIKITEHKHINHNKDISKVKKLKMDTQNNGNRKMFLTRKKAR